MCCFWRAERAGDGGLAVWVWGWGLGLGLGRAFWWGVEVVVGVGVGVSLVGGWGFRGVLNGGLNGWFSGLETGARRRRLEGGAGDVGSGSAMS